MALAQTLRIYHLSCHRHHHPERCTRRKPARGPATGPSRCSTVLEEPVEVSHGTKGLSSSASNGDVNGDDAIDSDIIIIHDYLNDLGALAHDMNRAALANMSHYALRGGGEDQGLRGQVVKTILWQEYQDLRVETLISHLIENDLITFDINPEDAASSLNDHLAGTVCPIIDRFNKVPQISGLQVPDSKDCIHVFYEDAFQRLVNVLACNQLLQILQPKEFSIDIIQEAIVEFLQEY